MITERTFVTGYVAGGTFRNQATKGLVSLAKKSQFYPESSGEPVKLSGRDVTQ